MKETNQISTKNAPEAIGPYSQAIAAGNMIFTAGQIPIKPDGTDLTDRPVQEQTRQVLENIRAVLEAGGTDMNRVIKTTVFLKNMADFQEMNAEYEKHFSPPFPARSAVAVAALPKNADVEIEAVAVK